MQAAGLIPNYQASVGKLYSKELRQRVARTRTQAFGLYGTLWMGDPWATLDREFTRSYVASVPATIAGGTSEIQRNVIATRGLGLPRS